MKVFAQIICFLPTFLLLFLAFTSVTSSTQLTQDFKDFMNYKEEDTALLETINGDMDDANDSDLADIQYVFNVLAQVEVERKKLMMKNRDISAQFMLSIPLSLLGSVLWGVGKTLLKNKFCPKNASNYMPGPGPAPYYNDVEGEKTAENDAKALNQLKVLFGALKEIEAKIMRDDIADSENAKAQILDWIMKKIGGVVKKFIC